MAFDKLPEDMKPFMGGKKKEEKDDDKSNKSSKHKVKKEIDEGIVDITDDRDLDFTKMDNVELILTKYKN